MLRNRSAAWQLLTLGAMCATLGCGGGSQPTGNRVSLFPLMAEGWLNGSSPDQSSLKGKVIVVNVWAFW